MVKTGIGKGILRKELILASASKIGVPNAIKELILASASKIGVPNAIVVISLGFVDDKLLIDDCMMETTINNLKFNPKIAVVSGKIKITGFAETFSGGKIFDICLQRSAKISSDKVRNAILISIKNVFDLFEAKIIYEINQDGF